MDAELVEYELERAGIGHGLRLPLTPLSPEHAEAAEEAASRIQQLEQQCRGHLAA